MTDETTTAPAPAVSEDGTIVRTVEGTGPLDARAAAQALAAARWGKPKESNDGSQSAQQAQPEPQESASQEVGAAPPEEATGETQEVDPGESPSLDPPRSWSSEARERWAKLDPDVQKYLLDRDSKDSAAVRKAQNEAAEARKAAEAERQQVEKARQQYETALPQLLQAVQASHDGEFADLKTWADVERMATEDPIRYNRWNAQQQKLAVLKSEADAARQRQEQEHANSWASFAQEQDKLFSEKVPDIANPEKASKLRDSAGKFLQDRGFNLDELGRAWNGQGSISLRDHRLQLLILDAMKYRDAQESAKKLVAQPKPPVQRPGSSHARVTADEANILALEQAAQAATGSYSQARAEAALIAARRAAAGRK